MKARAPFALPDSDYGPRAHATLAVLRATMGASVGDLVIIAAFAQIDENEMPGFKPKLVFVNPDNRIQEERSTIPVQRA